MTRPTPQRSGAMIFEMMVALAVFITTGLAIMGVVRQSQASLLRSIELARATDLARSAAAEIEAGIATVDELDGPVEGPAPAFADAPAQETGWTIDIETDLAGENGLTLLTVTASRDDDRSVRHSTRRLLVLASGAEAEALEDNELQSIFDRAAEQEGRSR